MLSYNVIEAFNIKYLQRKKHIVFHKIIFCNIKILVLKIDIL